MRNMKSVDMMSRPNCKKCKKALLWISLAALLLPQVCLANGFYVPEASARSIAQGGASVADLMGASVVFFNPAMISLLENDFNAMAGLTTYFPSNRYQNPKTGTKVEADDTPIPVPYGYFTYRPVKGLGIGIGANTRFGLPVKWPDKWDGYSLVRDVNLQSSTLAVCMSYAFLDWLSFGVSFDTTFGSVDLSRGLDFGSAWGLFRFGGSAVGFSASAAVYAKPLDWLAIGFTYHGPTKMELDNGKADFDVPNRFAQLFPDQNASTKLILPDVFQAGIRFWPHEDISIELDIVQVQWHRYDKLTFNFDKGLGDPPVKEQTEYKNWYDALQVRLGAAWKTPLENLSAYAGFIYDGLAVPSQTVDPMLPDNHRIDFGIGIGYKVWRLNLDLGYLFVYFLPREVGEEDGNPFPAKYKALSHVLSFNVGFEY
ncbi:MAG: hypothetical protein GXP49_04380 [Deltaproteobacteria bacterium]|nr:hypothetical protein [Deltaproteobacteria bacterium]